MKVGFAPINTGIESFEEMVGLAQRAEFLGYESAWTYEHILLPANFGEDERSRDKPNLQDPTISFVDPLISLAVLASKTTTLRLATGINILPQSNPMLLAKQAASLDLLSNGRLMLGLGLGWLREEYEAMGVPWERRGARFDDYVVAMRKVWSGDVVEHQSDFINWSGFVSYPLPKQPNGVPIIIGGAGGKTFQRVARLGDGWFAQATGPESLKLMMEPLKAAFDAERRDLSKLEITTFFDGQGGLDAVRAFQEMGVSRVVVLLEALGVPFVEGVEKIADEIIGKI